MEASYTAALRADLYNTAGWKTWDRAFTVEEFMGGIVEGVEEQIAKMVATGNYTPSEAASIVCSRRSKKQTMAVFERAGEAANRKRDNVQPMSSRRTRRRA